MATKSEAVGLAVLGGIVAVGAAVDAADTRTKLAITAAQLAARTRELHAARMRETGLQAELRVAQNAARINGERAGAAEQKVRLLDGRAAALDQERSKLRLRVSDLEAAKKAADSEITQLRAKLASAEARSTNPTT